MRENWMRHPTLGQAPRFQISVPGLLQGSAESDCRGFHSRLQGGPFTQARVEDLFSVCAALGLVPSGAPGAQKGHPSR